LYPRHETAAGAQLFAGWGALRGVELLPWRCCDPFVPVADVLGIVVSAIWCGTGCLVEPNYHGGVKYRPDAPFRFTSRGAPRARRACDKGLMGRLQQGAGGRRVAICVSQVLTCVTCMVRPR